MQENGKVLADNEEGTHRAYGIRSDYYDNKNSRPLRLKKKLYEFYTAPITKFWANAVSMFKDYFFKFNANPFRKLIKIFLSNNKQLLILYIYLYCYNILNISFSDSIYCLFTFIFVLYTYTNG